jgi:putative ABC transport system substrate-binding protein
MHRRQLITLLGGAAAWPLAARAQRPAMPVVGVINLRSAEAAADSAAAFRKGLGEAGYVEGRNVTVEYHWLDGDLAAFTKAVQSLGWTPGQNVVMERRFARGESDRMRSYAKELVEWRPDVIVGHTTPVVAALQNETHTIPIVFVIVSDPVGSGFISSLPNPGGNITGFINLEGSLGGKWIQLLKEAYPQLKRAGIMFNPNTASYWEYYQRPFDQAAHALDIQSASFPVASTAEIERAVTVLAASPGGGLVVMPDTFTAIKSNLDLIIANAAHYQLPAIYPYRYMASAGGLMSYGIDVTDLWRRSATYVDRILKGTAPAELPVQLPTKFELAVNLKTARALGLTVPPTLRAIADEVIE